MDLSPEMLHKAYGKIHGTVGRHLVQADAQHLPVKKSSFDVVILTLILSVVPDGQACWRETLRTLRPGVLAIIFDKFLPDNQTSNYFRELLNQGAKLLGTDINRHLSDILVGTKCTIIMNEPSLLNGIYRIILIQLPERITTEETL